MAKLKVLPLHFVPGRGRLPEKLNPAQRRWANANGFACQRGRLLALPGADGSHGLPLRHRAKRIVRRRRRLPPPRSSRAAIAEARGDPRWR